MYPYVGEIQAFAFGFAPRDWLPCDGRVLPVQSNTPLFALIGALYGGNGTTNFALPNLNGRVTMNQGQGPGLPSYSAGEPVGSAEVSLSTDEMPSHVHTLQVGIRTSTNGKNQPAAGTALMDPSFNGFVAPPAATTLAPTSVALTGGSVPHANSQPTLAIGYFICVSGIFPSFG
ncbi:MAG: tail fiber protein [Tardiphaga sp.]